jgi:hypothetical protein
MLTMKISIPTVAAAVLLTIAATPVFAQAAVQEPGLAAFNHPDADVLNGGRGGYRAIDSANAYYGGVAPISPARHSAAAPRHHRSAR